MTLLTNRKAARDAGEHKYFTGKPCSHGHVAPRYTQSGTCQECIRANVAATAAPKPHESRYGRCNEMQLDQTHVRCSAENRDAVADLAFNMTRIRYPWVMRRDVERRVGGRDAAGGFLLYTFWLHHEDAVILQAYAKSLIPKTVDVAATRARIFGTLICQAEQNACAEPAFRP